jgi:acyl-coenzyme A thioesterase PaaI-like protein
VAGSTTTACTSGPSGTAPRARRPSSRSRFTPAITGVVYGGLLASLIDCHAVGTAAAARYAADDREVGSEPVLRYVTGLLQVSFKAPTPMGGPLTLRAWPVEVGERKVVVDAEVIADGQVTVTGHVIAVRLRHDSTGSVAP